MRKPVGRVCLCGLAGTALFLAACARNPHLPGDQADEQRIVVLEPWDTANFTQTTARVLAAAFPKAERAALSRFDQVFAGALAHRRLVVIPHLSVLPCEVWKPLEDFLEAGGCAVLWGSRPFAERVWTSPSGLQRERDLAADLAGGARPATWSAPSAWMPDCEPAQSDAVVRVVSDPAVPWPALEASFPSPARWSGLSVSVPPGAALGRDALICFARGDERTTRLQFEAGDGSGTWWRVSCPLGPDWRPVLLPMDSFVAAPGQEAAAGSLTSDRLAVLRVGIDGSDPDTADAPHRFGLSEVRRVQDPRPVRPQTPGLPGLPGAAGATWVSATSVETANGAIRLSEKADVAVLPEPSPGCGEVAEGTGRWIPLARVRQGNPDRSGVCAQQYADLRPGRPLRRYGWLSLDAPGTDPAAVRRVLRDLVTRLQNGHLILESGAGMVTVREDQDLAVSYRHAPELAQAGSPVRVNVELLDADGVVVRRVSASPHGLERQRLDLGHAPRVKAEALNLGIRLRVIDPASVAVLDEVEWPLRVARGRDHVPPRRPVETTGSLLADTGRPIFPLIQAWDEPAGTRRALVAATYSVRQVTDWLDRAREIGFNTVAVTVDRADQLPQYAHLADELESRRMFALLRLSYFPVLHTDWAAARALTHDLARNQTEPVLALDIAAPELQPPETDPAWSTAWAGWLAEQFGSLAQAASHLGCATEADATAAWGRPADALSPALRLARRRCRADLVSRHVAAVRGLVRDCGLLHALTLSPPAASASTDPACAAAHLDVLTVAARLRATGTEWAGEGFAAAWARGSSGGRPVWWMESGPGISATAAEVVLQEQGTRWRQLFQLLRLTSAAGGWLAAPADGSPSFLRADGQWRPAAAQMRAFSHQLRGAPLGQAAAWGSRLVDAWAEPAGWPGLCAQWGPRYREEALRNEFVEVRPAGFGVETRRLEPRPLLGAGPVVPWQELNAEWTGVLVNGARAWRAPGGTLTVKCRDTVQLTVCNTGAGTWTPMSSQRGSERMVQARVSEAGQDKEILSVPRLAMGQSGTVEWKPSGPGLFRIRIAMAATGPWGEELIVRVRP